MALYKKYVGSASSLVVCDKLRDILNLDKPFKKVLSSTDLFLVEKTNEIVEIVLAQSTGILASHIHVHVCGLNVARIHEK